MKRLMKITLVAMAVVAAALVVWHLTGPHSLGELYRHYADQPGVRVGYIKDYPFDDTTHVDVTTIEALDDDGWAWMQQEFGTSNSQPSTSDPQLPTLLTLQRPDGTFLFLSYNDRSLCLVDAESDAEYDAVLRYQLTKMTNTTPQQ